MEEMVEKVKFSEIQNKNVSLNIYNKFGKSIDKEKFGSIVKLKSESSSRTMDIVVEISPIKDYKKRALEYLDYIMNDSSNHSLS